MSCGTSKHSSRVTLLTLSVALSLILEFTGCSYMDRHYGEPCKNRAYIGNNLAEYITRRFDKKAPVRMAIVPYSVPANLSYSSSNHRGLGDELAWRVHSEMLPTEMVPILEVFNRQDWPGKTEEFYTGNYGALQLARDAGYDLVLVGNLQPQNTLEAMTVRTKIIEVESGLTVFYGESSVFTNKPLYRSVRSSLWMENEKPSQFFIPEMVEDLGRCIVHGVKVADGGDGK